MYTCPLKLAMGFDPEIGVNATYVFNLAELTILRDVLVTTMADVKSWSSTPVMRHTTSAGTPPLLVHADLNYVFGEPEASEPGPASCPRGKVDCSKDSSHIGLSKLRLHVGGNILEDEVRHVYKQ